VIVLEVEIKSSAKTDLPLEPDSRGYSSTKYFLVPDGC
jgi:hypothetical protein